MRGLLVVALLGACAELPAVPAGVCGNGVVEAAAGEECDGAAGCGAADGGNACYLVCDPDQGGACPDGYQCGADLRCRRPTEAFALATVQPVGPYGASTADMDGDGAADLLGYDSRGLLIRWGGDDTAVFAASTRVALPLAPTAPAAPDVDGDGARDLAVPVADVGYGLFVADGARGLVPAAQSAVELAAGCAEVVAGTIRTDGNAIDQPEILLAIGGAVVQFIDQESCEPDPDGDCTIAAGGGAVVGDGFATGTLGYGALHGVDPDEQFTIAVAGASTISVWGDHVDPGTLRPEKVGTWTLDEPIGADGAVWIDRFDGDACPDLVVDTGAGGSLQVVYGTCLGLAGGAPVRHARPPGPVIGAGDADGDGIGELIYAVAVDDATFDGWVVATWAPASDRSGWAPRTLIAVASDEPRDAIVVDYNRDGFADVALAHAGAPTVDFLMSYAGGGYTRFPVDVGGVPRHLARGDFDGDLHGDVVVTAANAADPEGRDRVVVLYGEPDGRPVAQHVGDFAAAARPARVAGGVQPQIDSVLVVSNDLDEAAACTQRLAVLIGDTSRLPLSPYVHLLGEGVTAEPVLPLRAVDVSTPEAPRVLAIGFIAPPAGETLPRTSIAVLDVAGAQYAYGGLETSIAGVDLPPGEVPDALWQTGEIDGDPATVDAVAVGGGHAVVVHAGADALAAAPQPLADALADPTWLELADVDGDGDDDALGISDGRLWLVDNDGGLDFADPSLLELPPSLSCGAADVIVSTESGLPQLATVCYASNAEAFTSVVAIATIEGGALTAPRAFRVQGELVGVAVDDFTGDGLDDVAVIGTQTVGLYRQCRADEVISGACEAATPL